MGYAFFPRNDPNAPHIAFCEMCAMKQSRVPLFAIFSSTFLQLAAGFMLMPWLLYRLNEQGVSVAVSGALAASSWIGILLIAPVAGRWVQRVGRQRSLWIASLMSTVATAGILVTPQLEWWFALVLLESFSAGLRWVVGEALVVELAPSGQCGRCVGLYETLVGSTFFVGPVLLNLLGTDSPAVPWGALLLNGSALGLTLWLGNVPAAHPLEPHATTLRGLPKALQRNSALVVIAFVGGFFEGGVSTVLPIYGLSLGYNTEMSTWMVASSGLASAAVMLPAGLLVDHMGRQRKRSVHHAAYSARIVLMRWCSAVVVALTMLMPWLSSLPWMAVAVAFAWGGAGGCLYTLSVIDMGERETGGALLDATALLVLAYTLGAIVGPLVGAAAMQWWSQLGFPALLLAVSAIGCAALARSKPQTPAQALQFTAH
jgi:MFS family permease